MSRTKDRVKRYIPGALSLLSPIPALAPRPVHQQYVFHSQPLSIIPSVTTLVWDPIMAFQGYSTSLLTGLSVPYLLPFNSFLTQPPEWSLKSRNQFIPLVCLRPSNNSSLLLIFNLFIINVYLFLRERDRAWTGERQRKRERHTHTESEAGSRLRAVSTESDMGLELTDCEITTSAEVGCLTD